MMRWIRRAARAAWFAIVGSPEEIAESARRQREAMKDAIRQDRDARRRRS